MTSWAQKTKNLNKKKTQCNFYVSKGHPFHLVLPQYRDSLDGSSEQQPHPSKEEEAQSRSNGPVLQRLAQAQEIKATIYLH